MSRIVTVAAAQLGPISRGESRAEVIARKIKLLERAKGRGANLVVFPEASLTPFFPHWAIDDQAELESYFETEIPNKSVQPLFDSARNLGLAFSFGFAELVVQAGQRRRFNTSLFVDAIGRIVGKYRKVHLPGYSAPRAGDPFQNLEKRYFEVGDLGFEAFDACGGRVGMLICNDRRWPEAYRMLGLQHVELVTIGYNTPVHNPAFPETDHLADFHSTLAMQAGAYQNSTFVIGVAKAGTEEGVAQIGSSCIIAPSGEILAQAETLDDELLVAPCDLDIAARYRSIVFNPEKNRQPHLYKALTEASPSPAASLVSRDAEKDGKIRC